MDNERYLYEIRPIKPIKDLIPGKLIKKPCSMQLTKDEVLHCMKYGSVWRRFTGKDPLKVTGNNLDFMHRSVYSDYIKPVDQKKAEESEIVKAEEVIEQSIEEENIALEESPKESEEELQNSSNTTAEEELVESSEDITVDEVAVEDNSDNTEETTEETVENEVEEIADTIINEEEVSEEQESDKKEEPIVGATINNDKHSNSIKINTSNNYKNNKHKK